MTISDKSIKLSNDNKYNYPKLNDSIEIYREIFRKYAIGGITIPISNDESIYAEYKSKYVSPFSMYRFSAIVCPFCRKPINDDEITPYCYTCGVKVRLR